LGQEPQWFVAVLHDPPPPLFAQSTLVRHWTQAPVVVLQTSGRYAPGPGGGALGMQSVFVMHWTQSPVVVLQTTGRIAPGGPPWVQSVFEAHALMHRAVGLAAFVGQA
jgi:hypothetical protein